MNDYVPFELVLRSIGRETVVLAGTAIHQCVEATGRDAIGLGFYPVLVRDATASRSLAHHQMAVEDFNAHLGYATSSTRAARFVEPRRRVVCRRGGSSCQIGR